MTKTVLVTGSSSGFGEACATTFAKHGFKVVMGARNVKKLLTIKDSADAPEKMYAANLDVRKIASINHFVDSLPKEFSDIDILVNNAGLALGMEPAHKASLEDWETMIDTNIKGLVRMTHRILPAMVSRNSGQIINIGSIAGSWPYPGGNTYGATKSFVQQFSRGLRADLIGKNIRVCNLEPGMSETNFSVVRMKGDEEKAATVYDKTDPLTAQDIADIVLWLCSVPEHVNVNSLEVMPACQSWGPFAVSRNMKK